MPEFDAGEGNRQVSVRSNRDPTAGRVAALGLPRKSQDFRGPGKAKITEGTVAEPRKREGGVGAVGIRHRSRDCPTGSRSTPSIVKVRPQAAWAFSSDGQSARLITARSVVRSHKGPYPSSGRGGPRKSARAGRDGLPAATIRSQVKRSHQRGCSSAGRAPALQAGGRQFESGHLHRFSERRASGIIRCSVSAAANRTFPCE